MVNLDEGQDILDKTTDILTKKENVMHMLSQHNLGVGILTCISECHGFVKNEHISKIIGCEIWGKCYAGLNDYNSNVCRTIDLSSEFFSTLLSSHESLNETNFKKKNSVYCNIYREMLGEI